MTSWRPLGNRASHASPTFESPYWRATAAFRSSRRTNRPGLPARPPSEETPSGRAVGRRNHPSRGGHAAVDVEGLADDVAGFARGQEHVGRREFGGLAGPTQRGVVAVFRNLLDRKAARD